jgi:16S rRNA (cytidine1402-2'-O)-methyltransferase
MLTIVPTPIGNLKDITLRALEVLQASDGIICEDTRRSVLLLNHYQIKKPLMALNDFNEKREFPRIIDRLKNGENLALISDAGTPLVSDPGYKLVRECLKEKIPVDSLPGPSSVTTALTLSGLPPDKFLFWGYLPDKPGQRQQHYQKIKEIYEVIPTTFIIFVAPFKLIKTLEEINGNLGNLEITLAKELTKIHQTVKTKKITDWLDHLKKNPPKGEYILLMRNN